MVERHSARAFDDDAEDVDRIAVDIFLARMGVHRQRGHSLYGLADRLVAVGEIESADLRSVPFVLCRTSAIADTRSVRQQIADRDLAFCFDHIVTAAVFRHRYGRVGKLRDKFAHRI